LDGVATILVSNPLDRGVGILRFDIVGEALRLYLDDAFVAAAHDDQLESGMIGISGTTGGKFDEFSAQELTTSTLTPPLNFDDLFNQDSGTELSNFWGEHAGSLVIDNNALYGRTSSYNLATLNGVEEG